MRSCPAIRPAAVRNAGSSAHSGSPMTRRRASHCSSVATARATQECVAAVFVRTRSLVQILGRCAGSAIPATSEQRAVRGDFDRLLSGDVHRRFDHCRLDQAAFTGSLPVLEGEKQPEERMQSGVGITDEYGPNGSRSGCPVSQVSPRRPQSRTRTRPDPPWTLETEPWHAEHDHIWPMDSERLVVQTQLIQYPRRVVLDHHVARPDELAQEVDSLLIAKVDGETLLVRVERGEDRAALRVTILRLRHASDETGTVGPGRRFEVNDLGAEERQDVAGERPAQ